MAKKSSIQKNLYRQQLSLQYRKKRNELKQIIMKRDLPAEERFAATIKLAEIPRNSAENRFRNRCALTGRPRAVYRKFKLSRIAFREFASRGMIPGVVKASW